MNLFSKAFYHRWLYFLFLLFLPTQLGKHFFLDFSYVNGVRVDYLAPTLYLLDIIAIGLFALNWKVIANHVQKHARIFSVLAILVVINILFAREPMMALYTAARYAGIYLVFILFVRDFSLSARVVLLPLFIGSAIELGLSLYQISAGHSVQGVFYWLGERAFSASTPGIATISLFGNQVLRPYGTLSHPNSMGGFYALVYAFVLLYPRFLPFGSEAQARKGRNDKLLRFGLLLFSSCLILISFSKVAILCFLLVNAYYLVKGIKLDCKLCKIARVVSLGVVSAIFLSGQSDILSLDKRIALMKQSIELLVQHPLFGVGLGNSLYYQSDLISKLPYSFIQPVHNILLLFTIEVGIVGIIMGVIFLRHFRLLGQHLELRGLIVDCRGALFWCLVVIGITGLFDHYWLTLVQNQMVMAVVLGSGYGSLRTDE